MVGYIFLAIFFLIVVSACCSSDSSTSSNNTVNTRSKNTYSRRNSSYSECPSCGAPGYDGYCEECGYPDINQGWIGENY